MRIRAVRVGAVAVAGALLIAGCGGGGDDDEGGYVEPKGKADETIGLESGNFYFRPDDPKAAAGIASLELDNEGGIHTFVFDDAYPGFQLEVSGAGDTDAKKIDLKPGTYEFYCDIPGHRQQGMEGTLTVS